MAVAMDVTDEAQVQAGVEKTAQSSAGSTSW